MDASDWNLGRNSALIQTLDEFCARRDTIPGKVIMTSGGFDPIHPGHMTSFADAKWHFEKESIEDGSPWPILVVVVNGDSFLDAKKGRAFLDLRTRCQIVSMCKDVDVVIPFEIENDQTVIKAIEKIRPDILAKGGDRTDFSNIPEWDICQKLGVDIVTGMGEDKNWSSTAFLDKWVEPFRDYIEILENTQCGCKTTKDT